MSFYEQHNSNITFRLWIAKNRLKRSSVLQFDNDINNDINMKQACLDIIQEPCFPFKSPTPVKIILDLLELCKKMEPKGTIRRKGMDTILILMKSHLVTAYTNGSSDSECNRGVSGVFLTYPNGSTSKYRILLGNLHPTFG